VKPRTDVNAVERGADVHFPPPLVFLAGILVGVILRSVAFPLRVPIARTITITGGVLIIALGIALVGSARLWHARTGQSPIPWKPTPALIFQGPYRFTRNPMYVGLTIIQLGLGVALNNLWIALFALPALLVVHFMAVLPEETYLAGKFGDPYRAYLRQVRRYL
jgi:protein-S-isoprenylcysteine O-methyltransferase Ste14